MKSNSKTKAQSAFKKLGAVALITATMFFVTCKQTSGGGGGGKPTPTPKPTKYTVTLNQAEHGKVTASPAIPADKQVLKDTVITFTAEAYAGYKIGKWTVTGSVLEAGTGADGSSTAKVKITANTSVSVSFEAIPKHAITFSVDSTTPNGTLKAKVDGGDIASGKEVEEGKTVTFTATANAGYRVKGWTLDGSAVNGTNNSYSFPVSKAVTVKVSFEDNSIPLPKHKITFSVDSTTPNGTLKAKADGVTETSTSPINVEEGKTVTFTAEPSTNYKVKEWKVGDTVVTGNKTNTYAHTVTKAVTVKVSFEDASNPPNPPTPTPTKHTVTLNQTEHGKVTASPEIPEDKKVLKDTEITFTAKADDGYKIGTWTVSPSSAIKSGGNKGEATAKVKITADTTVSVSFELLPQGKAILTLDPNKLTIEVKAKTADGSAIQVEGCTVPTLASDTETTLTATGTVVILKGNITEFRCKGTYYNEQSLTALNVQGLTALKELNCDYNQLTTLDVQGLTKLQKLDCGGNKLTSLDVQGLTELQDLNCGDNQLTSLDVQGLTKLQDLNCGWNKLTALDVSGLTALQKLSCGGNQLSTFDVKGLTALQKLICNENKLTALDVSGLTALQKLDCHMNLKLTTLDVQGCTALQELDCHMNFKLTTLDVSGLTKLQKLGCGGNQLTSLDVQGLTELQELNCGDNQLTTLDVQGLTYLQKLNCGGNKLTELNVQGLTELQDLNCQGNELTALDVQGLTKLQDLNCGWNKLTALDVSGLTALQKLYCDGGDIRRYLSELNVQGCTSLKTLKCHRNKLNADAFIKIFNDLPTREVSDGAEAVLYKDRIGYEDNCTNFSTPESLKKAFEDAKNVKHWKMQKVIGYDTEVEI